MTRGVDTRAWDLWHELNKSLIFCWDMPACEPWRHAMAPNPTLTTLSILSSSAGLLAPMEQPLGVAGLKRDVAEVFLLSSVFPSCFPPDFKAF